MIGVGNAKGVMASIFSLTFVFQRRKYILGGKEERWPTWVLKKQIPVEKIGKKIHFYNSVVVSLIIQTCKRNTEGEHRFNLVWWRLRLPRQGDTWNDS